MRKVLVTGAGGFLGGWTVESFQLAGLPVRAGIRRWNSAVRLARRAPEIVLCDVLSRESLRAALSGCDAVVHCAAGNEQVTVEGTRNVLATACEMQVRRIVHLSSVAVYGKAAGLNDETHERRSRGNAYAKQKIAAEQTCEDHVARGAPVVLLRPSIIYGPFSKVWTVSFARRLASHKWGTFGRYGNGKCNLVYVTDVVQAIYRALTAENGVGEAFNINGREIISWNDYFTRFNEALGFPPLRPIDTRRIVVKARLLSPVREIGRFALSRFGNSITRAYSKSPLAARYMKSTESSLKLTPTPEQLKLYGIDAEYPIDKARHQLGYEPMVEIAQGLESCVSWLRHHELLF